MNEGQDQVPHKVGLAPIAGPDSRLFLLGSLPGDASLAAGRYYAHPRNQFWRLLGQAVEEPLDRLDYRERLERLSELRIGLWDVVERAVRPGSLDQAMRKVALNPLPALIAQFPDLRAIAFNGRTAAEIGRKQLSGTAHDLVLIDLPSSSPANTQPYDDKAAQWSALRGFLG